VCMTLLTASCFGVGQGLSEGAIPWCWDYYSKVLEGTLVLCAFARTKPDALQGVLLGRSGI
jgi:hypothetical protein